MPHTDDWLSFWQSRDITPVRDAVWRMNLEYFVQATEPILRYASNDVVLDVGCGAGYLQESLHPRVGEMHGVDISQRYLDYCERKFRGVANCHFHKLDEARYTDLSFLPEGRFTKIVCLSVIQYYKRPNDLGDLVGSLRRVAAPGALCLIADIPMSSATGADALSLLALAARRRVLLVTLRYLYQMRSSEYRGVRAREGVRAYSADDLRALGRNLGVDCEIIEDQLTVNRTRYHWLIRF